MANPKTSDELLRLEMDALLNELKEAYLKSGKKTSGQFGENLSVVYSPNSGTIRGNTYLAGRRAGRMPPVANILEWIKQKGVFNVTQKGASGLAWAIAKKIAREGTNKNNNFKIYEEVITPQRVQKIIDSVSRFNANRLITQITGEFEILAKNV
jgi:hypothetical protein